MYEYNEPLKEASKANPCPICGKTDWCFIGEDVAICGRADIAPRGWKQISVAKDGRLVFKVDSAQEPKTKKIININRSRKSRQSSVIPIPTVKLCELPDDREASPQPAETSLLKKPKKAGENADEFQDIIYRYSETQWVTRTQWIDPDHPKGRDKIYCQWHLDNGKAIAKKGERGWPAYRIKEATNALSRAENGNAILWVEGEPNVESARSLGLAAVTLMGANWQKEAIEDTLISLIHENRTPLIIDLIESDKPGLAKKDKLQSVCRDQKIPYIRMFPSELWPEKPLEVPTESADITDLIKALGADEVRQRLEHRLGEISNQTVEAQEEEEEEEEELVNIFHSKLNRKRLQIERGLGHRLEYNDFKKRIELDGEPICEDLDDQGGAKLFIAEQLDLDVGDSDAVAILNRVAKKQRYHPVRDYLEDCFKKYGKDTDILNGIALRYFGTTEPIHQTYLIKHLIGSVKRIFEPGCKHDTMLILKSEQGMQKSTFFKVLYGEDNFTDSVQGTEERDSLMALSLYWACEYAEFESITTKKDVSNLKAWLTRSRDDYRAPYAKSVKAHPRTFVLVGSTNRDDFLRDETGSRRFMIIPVCLPEIPIQKLHEERDRIWGAAVSLYQAGVTSWLTKGEMQLQKLINEDYSQIDPWAEIIADFLSNQQQGEFISTKTILEKALSIEARLMDSQATRRCSSIMIQLGWTKERRRLQGIQQWGWVRMDDLVVPVESSANDRVPAQAVTRCLQELQPSVPDVPVKKCDELSFLLAQQITDGVSEIESEKIRLKNLPAQPAQEPETLANNESEPVPVLDPVTDDFKDSTGTELKALADHISGVIESGAELDIKTTIEGLKELEADDKKIVWGFLGQRAQAVVREWVEKTTEPTDKAKVFSSVEQLVTVPDSGGKTVTSSGVETLFNQLKTGQKLKALKHPDHEMIRRSPKRKTGTVYSKRFDSTSNRFLAVVETDAGFETYNLEAVELVD